MMSRERRPLFYLYHCIVATECMEGGRRRQIRRIVSVEVRAKQPLNYGAQAAFSTYPYGVDRQKIPRPPNLIKHIYFLINTLLNVDASTPADIQSLYNVSHNFQTFYIYTNYYTRLPYHVQSLARWPGKCRSSWFKVRSNGCFPHPHLPRKSSKSKAHTIPPPKFKSLMNFVFRRTSPTSS